MALSPFRTHDRRSFFKYMTAKTAGAVLSSGRLRWSSPLLFNDPFDVPLELIYTFTPQEVLRAALTQCIDLIASPPEECSRLTPKLRAIVEAVKAGMEPSSKAALLKRFQADVRAATPKGDSLIALANIWRALVPELRILCLCESASHVAMWHHYSDQYRGAVLEFDCSDELDSAWLGATPVTYDEAGNALARIETWANLLVLETGEAVKDLTHLAIHMKSSDWKYEKEWRLLSYMREPENGLYTDYKFDPRELRAVYLGPRMAAEDSAALKALSRLHPTAKVYRTEIGLGPKFTFTSSDA